MGLNDHSYPSKASSVCLSFDSKSSTSCCLPSSLCSTLDYFFFKPKLPMLYIWRPPHPRWQLTQCIPEQCPRSFQFSCHLGGSSRTIHKENNPLKYRRQMKPHILHSHFQLCTLHTCSLFSCSTINCRGCRNWRGGANHHGQWWCRRSHRWRHESMSQRDLSPGLCRLLLRWG